MVNTAEERKADQVVRAIIFCCMGGVSDSISFSQRRLNEDFD